MKMVQSYQAKLVNPDFKEAMIDTIKLYQQAVSYLIPIVHDRWNEISYQKGKEQKTYVEKLIHQTKTNTPSYDFDDRFPKFSSYLRRSVIADAIGIVQSYQTNLAKYEEERYDAISNGKRFKKKAPVLSLKHAKCPAFYRGNMYKRLDDTTVEIKVFLRNDWQWIQVNLRWQDVKYIQKHCATLKESSPVLKRKGRNFYLVFAFTKKVQLNKTPLQEQKVVSVDLGINHSAVCTLMRYDGTVLRRLFINQSREKDHQNHLLNRLKGKQQKGGKYVKNLGLWAKINGLNEHIVNHTVHQIIRFAQENQADVIVCEYLDFKGKKIKGSNNLATKLHLWANRDIQKKIKHQAHFYEMRFRRVNARNTSALAFDGSGKVKRDADNASLCTFQTGKQYNCDLNASYNIGARYFIKEIHKSISAKKWCEVLAKDPTLHRRTQCTLSTLIRLAVIV